jgi:ABC-type oligopeptide transport system ATPase subunit
MPSPDLEAWRLDAEAFLAATAMRTPDSGSVEARKQARRVVKLVEAVEKTRDALQRIADELEGVPEQNCEIAHAAILAILADDREATE